MAESGNGTGRATTLEQVARAAGVSRATVSRVVNGSPKVAPDVRRTVERAVDRLGYVPNAAARSLVTRRSQSVALVIGEPTTRLFEDPFFPRLLRGVGMELASREQQLVLLMPQSTDEETRISRYLGAGHVDGALLVSLHGDDPLPDRLRERGIPVVVGGRPQAAASAVSYVDVDNVNGARSAVEHLLAHGRRRIATVTGPLDMSAGVDRLVGYREALAAAGIEHDPSLEANGEFSQAGGARAIEKLLRRHPDLDAVFAASDLMATAVLAELRRTGRRIPDDVAVVGYDDSSLAAVSEPPLSSVRQPIEEMGREMTRVLLEEIETGSLVPRRVILGTRLVIRRSSDANLPKSSDGHGSAPSSHGRSTTRSRRKGTGGATFEQGPRPFTAVCPPP